MLKKLTLFLFLFSSLISAQYQLDTLSNKQVGPGIFHTEIEVPSAPWTIDILEIDLTNEFTEVKTVKANDKLLGNEVVSSMAARNTYEGHTVVGAINGDFYSSGGLPIGTQIVNGEILKYSPSFSTIGIGENNELSLGRINYLGTVITKSASQGISQINSTRFTDYLVLFNSFNGTGTGTNMYGTEALLKPVSKWAANDTVECIVEKIESGVGNLAIPKGYAVLSGHGVADAFIKDNIHLGDTVKIVNRIINSVPKLKEMMGGYPRIVVEGKNYTDKGYAEEGGPPHTYQRHPRTAVGYSKNKTKMYFITVDGRSSLSQGMTLVELANLMIQTGSYSGLNLDGGGSTTMTVRDKVVNAPSGGSQRAVANGMIVVSTAPKSDTLSQMNLSPSYLKIFKGDKKTFKVSGSDKYFNPVAIDISQIHFSLKGNIGEITETGTFTAGMQPDSGYIFAEYQDLKDSCKVIIKSLGKIDLIPNEAMTDTNLTIDFRIKAWDVDNISKNIAKNDFNWSVEDESIGIIDSMGIFKGKSEGSTNVYVNYENLWDSCIVTVDINKGKRVLSSFDSISEWEIGGDLLDLKNCSISNILAPKTEGFGSMKVVYQYTGSSSNVFYVHLKTDIPIDGVPDSISVDLKTNGNKHQVLYIVEDNENEVFQINVKKWATESDFLDVQPGAFANVIPKDFTSFFNYPIRLKQVIIKLGDPRNNGVVYRDSLLIDNLRISYPEVITDVEGNVEVPSQFELKQNYPNPFNPTTTIEYLLTESENVSLNIFDILGNKIKTLVDENQSAGTHKVNFDASSFSSGVYFYSIKTDKNYAVNKMILIK